MRQYNYSVNKKTKKIRTAGDFLRIDSFPVTFACMFFATNKKCRGASTLKLDVDCIGNHLSSDMNF